MRKVCAGIFGVLTLTSGALCADGYCELDENLIAEKDFFPGKALLKKEFFQRVT